MAAPSKSSVLRRPASDDKHWITARTGTLNLPDRRSQPLLIQQWKYLWRDEFVELRFCPKITTAGWIDDITADGTILWINLISGKGRKMVHRDDGIDVWRVDSRICQNRSEPTTGSP